MAFTSLTQLVKTFDRHPARRQQQQFQRLLAAWAEIVGPAVAANARPVSIRRQRLVVATASPVWAQTLAFERHHILKKLRHRFPDFPCQDIQFSMAQQRWSKPDLDGASSSETQIASAALWRQHPARVKGGRFPRQAVPQSAAEAFQAWETKVRSRSQNLPHCPRCRCATPPGELERWGVCSLCVAQDWSKQ